MMNTTFTNANDNRQWRMFPTLDGVNGMLKPTSPCGSEAIVSPGYSHLDLA